MLIDGFNRKVDYLRLSVTDRCNFRCIYCMPAHGVEFKPREELLTYEELVQIVATLVKLGIEKVRITGGEPTARKDITELIRSLGQFRLKSLAMTTNGYLLSKLIPDLRQAGLQRINISLDTLRKDRFHEMTRFDGFEKVWQSIFMAMESGLNPVKLNMVVMRGINDDEIPDFVHLAEKHPLHVRFIEYMPSSFGAGNQFEQQRIMKIDAIKEVIGRQHRLEPAVESDVAGPAKMFKVDGFAGRLGFIDPYADHFCASCNRIRLTSLGQLQWCLFSNEGLDIKSFIRSGHSQEELGDWVRQRIISDKPERHPPRIDQLVQVNTVFSQVGG